MAILHARPLGSAVFPPSGLHLEENFNRRFATFSRF